MKEKLQLRLTFDENMGPLFVWLSKLPAKVRAREVMSLLRAGHAIVHGIRLPGAEVRFVPESAETGSSPLQEGAQPRAPARKAAVDTFGASFLVATPPLQ